MKGEEQGREEGRRTISYNGKKSALANNKKISILITSACLRIHDENENFLETCTSFYSTTKAVVGDQENNERRNKGDFMRSMH